MIKYSIAFILVSINIYIFSQEKDTTSPKDARFNVNLGSTYHGVYEMFFIDQFQSPSNRGINSRIILNSGIGFKFNLHLKSNIEMYCAFDINHYRTKYIQNLITINRTTGDTTESKSKHFNNIFSLEMNFEPIVIKFKNKMKIHLGIFGNQLIRSYKTFGNWGRNVGFMVGVTKPILKNRIIGIYIHQRLWFDGFNRELSRCTLRFYF